MFPTDLHKGAVFHDHKECADCVKVWNSKGNQKDDVAMRSGPILAHIHILGLRVPQCGRSAKFLRWSGSLESVQNLNLGAVT